METFTEKVRELLRELNEQRVATQGNHTQGDAGRNFSLAITAMEEALMRRNRAEAILKGSPEWWDPEKQEPRY